MLPKGSCRAWRSASAEHNRGNGVFEPVANGQHWEQNTVEWCIANSGRGRRQLKEDAQQIAVEWRQSRVSISTFPFLKLDEDHFSTLRCPHFLLYSGDLVLQWWDLK